MSKSTVTILMLTLSTFCAIAQAPRIQWNKTYHSPIIEEGSYVNTTSDGGYVTVSMFTSNERSGDICLRKLDANGKLLWKKNYGGSLMESPVFVQQTEDGGYFVVGNSASHDGDIKQAMEDGNIWAFKVNSKGQLEWEQIVGTDRWDTGYSGKVTPDGGYIVTGVTRVPIPERPGWSEDQVILTKLTSRGKVQWQKIIGGADEDNDAYDVQLTRDGGFVLAGHCRKRPPLGKSDDGLFAQYFVMKLDSMGNINWENRFGGDYWAIPKSIVACGDGSFVVVGSKDVASLREDCLVIKLNSSGKEIWRKFFGERGIDIVERAVENAKGEIIIAGAAARDGKGVGWLFKLDENGVVKWDTNYQGGDANNYFKSIQLTKDGGIIAAGHCYVENKVNRNSGYNQLWVVKLKD